MQITKVPYKTNDREQWLALRKPGIGGSEAAAVCGLDPYKSAFQVWADKIGIGEKTEQTEAMRQGTDLEPYVVQRFEEYTGKKVRRCNFILHNADYPYMLANVDRLVNGEKAGLECKTIKPTSPYSKYDFRGGEIPNTFFCQCQHYMAVTGFKKWYLAVLIWGTDFIVHEIPRSEEDIKALRDAIKDFWENNVIPKKEPAPDGSKAAAAAIGNMFPNSEAGKSIELPGHEKDLARYEEIETLKKALEKEQAGIKQRIQLEMGEAEKAYAAGKVISWKTVISKRLDSKRLKSEQPDIYARYAKESSARRFEIKENKA